MKKFLNYCLLGIATILITSLIFGIGYYGYDIYSINKKNQEQLKEIYSVLIAQQNFNDKILEMTFINLLAYKDINKKVQKTTQSMAEGFKNINKIVKQPSYSYLKSVTIPIFQEQYKDAGIGWIGTGTIIKITDDYTYVLTNKHVAPMTNKENIYVFNEGRYIKAEVVKNSAFVDLSLIKIDGKLADKQSIKGLNNIYYAEKVYSVGMYLGNQYIYTEGTVAGQQGNNVLMNLPSSFGCSGSGVFNQNGELIAVIYATNVLKMFDTDSAKAVCISINDIKLFLSEIMR